MSSGRVAAVAVGSLLAVVTSVGVADAAGWTNTSAGKGAGAAGTLSAPTTFSVACTSASNRTVTYSFSSVSRATAYSVTYSTNGQNGTYGNAQTVTNGATSGNLSAGTYWFQIQAKVGANWVSLPNSYNTSRTITHTANNYTCS